MNNQKTKKLYEFRKVAILIAICLVFTILLPGVFLTWSNIRSILYSVSLTGIMICGATFAVLIGGIDRTVSGNAAVAGACCCSLLLSGDGSMGSTVLAILAGLGCGILSGLFHGLVLSRFDIPAFLMTLATNQVLYGIVQYITQNKLINVMNAKAFNTIGSARILGIPVPVYILLICFLVSYVVLNHTVYGRNLYSVGGNREASKLSGINCRKVICIAYMISGFMGALSGLILSSMNQQASATQATGYENDVLAAIVVGGISLRGGSGTLQGAMFGAFLIGIISNGLRLLGIDAIYHDLVKGVIIIAAIAFDMYSSYSMSGMKKRGPFRRKASSAE